MKMSRSMAVSTSALLVPCCLLVVVGCAPPPTIENVWVQEGFSHRRLQEDGVILGGVVDATSTPDLQEEPLLVDLLLDGLSKGKNVPAAGDPETLALQAGPELYGKLIAEYRLHARLVAKHQSGGAPSPEFLAEITDCGVLSRYVLFACITRNEVVESEDSEYDANTDETKYRKKMTRNVDVVAQVLDLRAGALVWSAQGSQSLYAWGLPYKHREDQGFAERFIGSLVDAAFDSDQTKEPSSAPPTTMALEMVFDRLVKELKKA